MCQGLGEIDGSCIRRFSEDLRDLRQGSEARVLIENTVHEVLTREVVGLGSIQGVSVLRETGNFFGQAICRPIRWGSTQFGRCAGVDEFLEHAVDRRNIRCVTDCFQKLGG